mmetsp:Transcript_376/g.558  ORF Transcript_376/g.558 Transcript_376/m.558 type:complete len:610 (+) Transcript_376:2-1831(+)
MIPALILVGICSRPTFVTASKQFQATITMSRTPALRMSAFMTKPLLRKTGRKFRPYQHHKSPFASSFPTPSQTQNTGGCSHYLNTPSRYGFRSRFYSSPHNDREEEGRRHLQFVSSLSETDLRDWLTEAGEVTTHISGREKLEYIALQILSESSRDIPKYGNDKPEEDIIDVTERTLHETLYGLPEGWTQYRDPSSGLHYYHNAGINITTWTRPTKDHEVWESDNLKKLLESAGKGVSSIDPKVAVRLLDDVAGAVEDLKVPRVLSPVTGGVALGLDLTSGLLEKGVDAGSSFMRQLSTDEYGNMPEQVLINKRASHNQGNPQISSGTKIQPDSVAYSDPGSSSSSSSSSRNDVCCSSSSGSGSSSKMTYGNMNPPPREPALSTSSSALAAPVLPAPASPGEEGFIEGFVGIPGKALKRGGRRRHEKLKRWWGAALDSLDDGQYRQQEGRSRHFDGDVVSSDGKKQFPDPNSQTGLQGWDLVLSKLYRIGQNPMVRRLAGDSNIRLFVGVLFILAFSAMIKSLTTVLPQAILVTCAIIAYRILGGGNGSGKDRTFGSVSSFSSTSVPATALLAGTSSSASGDSNASPGNVTRQDLIRNNPDGSEASTAQ